MNRAGFYVRSMATVLDTLLLWGIVYGVEYAAWEWTDEDLTVAGEVRTEWLVTAAMLAVAVVYTAFEILCAATPGKMLLGLRVANFDGTPAPRWRLASRWLAKYQPLVFGVFWVATGIAAYYYLVSLTFWIVFIGCLWAMRGSRLAWHDEWAWTSVVRARRPRPLPSEAVVIPHGVGAA